MEGIGITYCRRRCYLQYPLWHHVARAPPAPRLSRMPCTALVFSVATKESRSRSTGWGAAITNAGLANTKVYMIRRRKDIVETSQSNRLKDNIESKQRSGAEAFNHGHQGRSFSVPARLLCRSGRLHEAPSSVQLAQPDPQ